MSLCVLCVSSRQEAKAPVLNGYDDGCTDGRADHNHHHHLNYMAISGRAPQDVNSLAPK